MPARKRGRSKRADSARTPGEFASAVSIGEHLRGILGDTWAGPVPSWPPDVFAAAGSLLRRSDAYSFVVTTWPPRKDWVEFIEDVGTRWRERSNAGQGPPPECARWWKQVVSSAALPIQEVRERPGVCAALLQLAAAADHACAGAGILDRLQRLDLFAFRAAYDLRSERGSTLCEAVHPSRAVVLPKMHTPRSGVTLRSLTHHLALWEGGEVETGWRWLPWDPGERGMNVLLLPWPDTVRPSSFRQTDSPLGEMPRQFKFFTADLQSTSVVRRVGRAVRAAEQLVGDVHAIVFPELALRSRQADQLCRRFGQRLIVGGIGEVAKPGRAGINRAFVGVPFGAQLTGWTQGKHHRWRIDGGQINQYGIGGPLDPTQEWWERIDVGGRQLYFLSVNGWLTMCVLICEDLARQDPVSDLVRAVGPNLVVCLLQDGPQLSARWPARYATVLADDPGSSVLTLTSLGMARLCRPPGTAECRVIALWKDARSPKPVEIYADDRSGVVLSLTREFKEEWTADGRSDGGGTAYLLLNGVHQVPC